MWTRAWLALAVAACTGGGSAGPVDAPDDAPALDAGTIDGAVIDGAVIDAAVIDAAMIDGAVIDAAMIDGAVIDGVPADARIDAPYVADASPCGITPSASPITSPSAQTPWVYTGWGLNAVSVFSLTAPMALASLSYEMRTYDADITVRAMCNGPVLSTGTPHLQIVDGFDIHWTDGIATGLAAGTYLIENYVELPYHPTAFLRVRGVIATGESCVGPLVSSGLLACGDADRCEGGICAPVACGNGLDDDGDGFVDDADAGCATVGDDDELDTCGSGGPCSQCADTVDSDGDGEVGWPQDLGCERRGDANEHNCPDVDAVVEVTTSAMYPLPINGASDHPAVPHCHRDGADLTFHLAIPGDLSALRVGVGQEAIDLTLYRDACHGPPDRCLPGAPGQGVAALGAVVAGDYWLVAKPYNATASISISGQHVAGARCLPSMPVFQCPAPQACVPDGVGGHHCQ